MKISPTMPEGKAVTSKRPKVNALKQLSLVFFLSILFTATPACAQDNEFKLEIKRSFPSSERPEGPDQHGDFSYFKVLENGGKVGSLHLFKPREAIFIIWDGEVIAGPLTTVEQVEEAYEMLSRESAAGHDLRTDIMKKYPMDRKKRYRVYDSEGKLIREDDEP
ncbi:MAG: hypothetical protein H0U54_05275 [Acidobacteria bacterium]|nr:hypothetical protein [Acidobacteriota bacterium]